MVYPFYDFMRLLNDEYLSIIFAQFAYRQFSSLPKHPNFLLIA